MGSQCDIDKKNVIMVNIEELSEEDRGSTRSCKSTSSNNFSLAPTRIVQAR
jgi:hypothetical protein